MAWFRDEMNYARESLEHVAKSTIEQAGQTLSGVVKDGVRDAGVEMREVVLGASREIDAKLDKISAELHNQRQFTKDDVKELVDYAGERLSAVIDARIVVMRHEITALVQDKVEYFKREVDTFFIQRQEDLGRERRRLIANVAIAVTTSILVGVVSWLYYRYVNQQIDLFGVFRIVFASLSGGYAAYLLFAVMRRWLRMTEHKKDAVFLAMRYWGVLRPESIFGSVALLLLLLAACVALIFPQSSLDFVRDTAPWKWLADTLAGRR